MRIFDKEKYIEDMGEPICCEERWVNECDGKKVVRIEEDDETYEVVGLPYRIAKQWTKEVEDIKTLEELGYEKVQYDAVLGTVYRNDKTDLEIFFAYMPKQVNLSTNEDMLASVTMEELKAIYKQCEDLGWI